jgi:hypothetical protein
MLGRISILPHDNKHRWSVKDCWSCILKTLRAMEQHQLIIILLAAFVGKNGMNDIATTTEY